MIRLSDRKLKTPIEVHFFEDLFGFLNLHISHIPHANHIGSIVCGDSHHFAFDLHFSEKFILIVRERLCTTLQLRLGHNF